MQMFGIGLPELMVILVLSVLVIGPDRLPQFAADLAKWIRQARAYATHLTKDFNEVVGELEKEAGTTREDWKEIASVVRRNTGDVARELQQAASQLESSATIDGVTTTPPSINGSQAPDLAEAFRRAQIESDRLNGVTPAQPERAQATPLAERPPELLEASDGDSTAPSEQPVDAPPAQEQPWFVPERRTRARRRTTE